MVFEECLCHTAHHGDCIQPVSHNKETIENRLKLLSVVMNRTLTYLEVH